MDLRQSKRQSRSVFVNVTSFIDVLFVLLLFFMVSTTFVSQPAMNLQLPTAEHAEVTRQSPVVVYIDLNGSISLNDEPVEKALLEQELVNRLALVTEKSVVLKADSRVSHGAVVEVLDMIKAAGVQKLVIATQPRQ